MKRDDLSSRERWGAVLAGGTPDRVPMDYWATEEATTRLLKFLNCDFEGMLARLRIDTPLGLTPEYVGPKIPPGEDVWGIRYRDADYGTGQYSEASAYPLAAFTSVDQIEAAYRWPSVDWWDFSGLSKVVAANEGRVFRGGGSEPFLLYKNLRGDEQAYLDLILNPEIVEHCLQRIVDIHYETTRRIFEAVPGKVLVTYVAEDLGGQDGLLYAPEHIRRYLLPGMRRMIALTRENGSYVFFHSDGAIRGVVPELIDAGIQVLNPIQWRCPGMDRARLKSDFGNRLTFHGGVDNQQTLPFGTPEAVRAEVEENLALLGRGGGYILAPCHNIQAITPPENIVALYEAGLAWSA
jgi:uroporphyrinogen decarboxylase